MLLLLISTADIQLQPFFDYLRCFISIHFTLSQLIKTINHRQLFFCFTQPQTSLQQVPFQLLSGCYNFNMYIDSPNFVRRRIVNSEDPSERKKQSQFYNFGKEREKIFSYVANTLLDHERDEQVLEKFRQQAQLLKKRKYQAKRHPKDIQLIPPVKSSTQRLHVEVNQPQIFEKDEVATPRRSKQPPKSPQLEIVLKHSNELVEKYRKLLSIKEKELKKKERKLESSKLAMQKMSLKMKELERQRKISNREEEVQLQKIEVTLRQMGTQIFQNKSSFSKQLSALKEEISHSLTQDLPKVSQFNLSHKHKENLPKIIRPNKQQLQNIKRKARSLKTNKNITNYRSPSVVYTKIPTQSSWQADSPRSKANLDNLNKSIIEQSRFRAFSGMSPLQEEKC